MMTMTGCDWIMVFRPEVRKLFSGLRMTMALILFSAIWLCSSAMQSGNMVVDVYVVTKDGCSLIKGL